MGLAQGTELGPYEIVAPLGAGGMGEVYRARDPRLGRDVAIKVLPTALASYPDRLRRFEQEARAAGQLNHPNILTVYDVGTHDGAPYIVSELLEGSTLRGRLKESSLASRKAVEFGVQIARGLAAAHEKGIVHRDLKPENVFITRDERVKILDFGLARLAGPAAGGAAAASLQNAATMDGGVPTAPGVVLGTVGYMSPEQVRGQAADARSDIFAFGAVLYEMLSGARAFARATAAETMTAILREEPKELSAARPDVPPALERVIAHCLEKDPGLRFQSARDLAFALEAVSGVSSSAAVPALVPRRAALSWGAVGLAALAVILVAAGSVWVGVRLGEKPQPEFRQLTFRRGTIEAARFAPDAQSVIYSAGWDGKPVQIFTAKPGTPGSSRIHFPEGTDLLAVSSSGELALLLREVPGGAFVYRGVLARSPVAGGAPREVLENVQYADWLPGGKELAVVRPMPTEYSLEFPMGTSEYKTKGWISDLRVSPDGRWAAFVDHPNSGDDGGLIAAVDREGHKRDLTRVFTTAIGLAWSPDGKEIWFTAADTGANRALRAVTLSSRERVLLRIPGILTFLDVSRTGRALLTRDMTRVGIVGVVPGNSSERDLSWLDMSMLDDLSADGKMVLFGEVGEGAGPRYILCLRNTSASSPVQLGEGYAFGLSPDGKWVLSLNFYENPPRLVLLPTGPGEATILSTPSVDLKGQQGGYWIPDGKRIFLWASQSGQPPRGYLYGLKDGSLRALTPAGFRPVDGRPISPDGKWIAMLDRDEKPVFFPVEGGSSRPLPGMTKDDSICGWSEDGRFMYITAVSQKLPTLVFRVNIATGARQLWKEIAPADPAGIQGIGPVLVTPDGHYYAYTYTRVLSDLFVVDGVK
jgi:serine/threonine protein kinase/Tol biopolymer transport system component